MALGFEGSRLKTRAVQHQHLLSLLTGAHAPDAKLILRLIVFFILHHLSDLLLS